jgi:dihydropyrimidinase
MRFDLVVRNARVATAADLFSCDIGIAGGVVAALGASLPAAEREIDAGGRTVTPGGVDAHCHFEQPLPDGWELADDFETGTRSAACGGTTTIIPFACQLKGASLLAAVEEYRGRAAPKAAIDYAVHLIVSDPTEAVLRGELPALVAQGYTSFKLYMTYDMLKLNDRELIETLAVARREGAMAMVHAENSDSIAWLTEKLLAAGLAAPKYHATSRPMLAEREATHRAVSLAEMVDVPILIVHVSSREAVEQIRWAQGRGLKIYAETCPQYLLLTSAALDQPDFLGAKCVCSPPPREKADQEAIWEGLANGVFQVLSSDHSPFRYDDPKGKKIAGHGAPFHQIPNGIPGVETRLPLVYSEGVLAGRITLNEFVALTATNPAKLYGLYPRKGTLAVGADADLVIWEQGEPFAITNEGLHHGCDYTPYEGMQVRAWPRVTLSRGEVVWERPRYLGKPGRGKFLACERPQPAAFRRRADDFRDC